MFFSFNGIICSIGDILIRTIYLRYQLNAGQIAVVLLRRRHVLACLYELASDRWGLELRSKSIEAPHPLLGGTERTWALNLAVPGLSGEL